MSRFKNYLENTLPLLQAQLKKVWRSDYLYLQVSNPKHYHLGRIGIELNTENAAITSRNFKLAWLQAKPENIQLTKDWFNGQPALKIVFTESNPSLGNFVESELHSKYAENEGQVPLLGDLIRADPSNTLYLLGHTNQGVVQKESDKAPKGNSQDKDNENDEAEVDPTIKMVDYIKVGHVSNMNGFNIMHELYANDYENINVEAMGSYKKFYTMRFLKIYIVVSLFSFYIVHFTHYKGKTTVPTHDLHDVLIKHH